MRTRAAFLADPTQRRVFPATPPPASWRHPMELWCSIGVRKWLKRASGTSVEDVTTRVLAFMAYFKATMAKPLQGTYGQKPLQV
jgi:hypothetical protein